MFMSEPSWLAEQADEIAQAVRQQLDERRRGLTDEEAHLVELIVAALDDEESGEESEASGEVLDADHVDVAPFAEDEAENSDVGPDAASTPDESAKPPATADRSAPRARSARARNRRAKPTGDD